MTVTRLTGGLTPGNAGDPRTFPAIFNDAADTIESQGSAVASQGSAIDALEALNPVQFGTAVPSDGQVLTFSTAVAGYVPEDAAGGGGLVEVKSAIFTGIQDASVAGGGNVAVTDLSITHEVANPSNKLIISAFFGAAATSIGTGQVGIAVNDGSGLIAIGNAAGSRSRVTAGGRVESAGGTQTVTMPSVTFVHTPGAGSKTYTVRAINMNASTRTLFINRSELDTDAVAFSRAVSSLVIQEVAV